MTEVLFRPLVENLEKPRQRAWFGEPCMTDRGDHVEYFDGKQTYRWRLPDQTGDYPEVSQLLIAAFTIAVGTKIAHYRVNFLDRDGKLLGRLNFRPQVYAEHFDRILPDSTLTQLAQHGVQIVRKTYRDGPAFHREYPDNISNDTQRSFQQHPLRWALIAIVLLVIVVNIVLFATGYYS